MMTILFSRSINKGPQSFMPLSREELPKAGDIVALDAEFVSLQPVSLSLLPNIDLYIFMCIFSCYRKKQ